MLKIEILLNCVILLYRERLLSKDTVDTSSDLVKSVLSASRAKKKANNFLGSNNGNSIEYDLSNLILKMIESPDVYEDSEILITELTHILSDDETYLNSIKASIEKEMTDKGLNQSVLKLRSKISLHYKELSIINTINAASYRINNDKLEDESISEYANKLIMALEGLCSNTKKQDPGLVDKLILSNTDDIDNISAKIKAEKEEGGILKTGWKHLNTCIQGGFRRGETSIICALQHNYKSGFVQSLAMQFARYNKPALKDKSKKAAIMYISLEDELYNVMKYMYRYLYFNENNELPDNTDHDISKLTTEELSTYIRNNLQGNGYELLLFRGDPGQWTYKNIFNLVNDYETLGYEIHCCIVDYLAKLPTTFCDNTGPSGTGVRDLFNRCRSFFSIKNICFITPHQLSTDAKQKIRDGVPAEMFVNEIAGKGYTELSKQIDQVVDLELYIHKAKIKSNYWLTVRRGKHRGQNIIEDDKLYFKLPFPKLAPIKEDINDPEYSDNMDTDEEEFDF